jgi:hypothetical protein
MDGFRMILKINSDHVLKQQPIDRYNGEVTYNNAK